VTDIYHALGRSSIYKFELDVQRDGHSYAQQVSYQIDISSGGLHKILLRGCWRNDIYNNDCFIQFMNEMDNSHYQRVQATFSVRKDQNIPILHFC
jgi:hypothetical protein